MADFYVLQGPYLVMHGHTKDGNEKNQAKPGQQVVVGDFTKVIPTSLPPFTGAMWNTDTLVWDDLRSPQQKAKALVTDVRVRRNQMYPPLEDLADALVHQAMGNNAPMDAYLEACIKVKQDNPKIV